MLNPIDIDFICGYLNPSFVSSSGSQSLNLEKVSKLVPLKNRRQFLTPILFVQTGATGMNLLEWDNLPDGFDPEAPYTENLIPFSRTYSIGVNVQF